MKKQHPHPSPSPTHLPPRIKQVNLQSKKISSLIEWSSAQLHLSRCWGIWIIVELIVPSFDGHRRNHIQAGTDHGPIPVGHAGIQTRVHKLRAEEKTLKALEKWNLTRKEVKHLLNISACRPKLIERAWIKLSNFQPHLFTPNNPGKMDSTQDPNRKKNRKTKRPSCSLDPLPWHPGNRAAMPMVAMASLAFKSRTPRCDMKSQIFCWSQIVD